MYDFACVYPRHNCELREEHLAKLTRKQKWGSAFKKIFFISPSAYRDNTIFSNKGTVQVEYIKQSRLKHWYIVHPFSRLRLCWEIFMVLILFLSIIFFPFKAGFLSPLVTRYYVCVGRCLSDITTALIIDLLLNTIWIFNALGNFVTGYYDKVADVVVMDPKAIVKAYWMYGIFLDLTSSVPIEPLLWVIYGLDVYLTISSTSFILLQVFYLFSSVRFRYYFRYCYTAGNLGYLSFMTIRLLFGLLAFFWYINWSIYCSLIIPQIIYGEELFDFTSNKTSSWSQASHLYEMTIFDQYKFTVLKALFSSIGVTTWENMYDVNNHVLEILISLSGKAFWMYFLVWLLEYMNGAHILRVKFILIYEQLKIYMKQKEVSVSMKKRLNRFYFYRFQSHYFRDRALLGNLTESLRSEISLYTCHKLIYNTEVFQSLPRKVVAQVIQRMNREMYFPNDVIIQANTFGDSLYFICSGKVAVWTSSGKEIARLEDGEFFGEIALIIEDRRRTATVTAVTITEVYRLEASDFAKLIELYPDVFSRLEKFAAKRFKTLFFLEGSEKVQESYRFKK